MSPDAARIKEGTSYVHYVDAYGDLSAATDQDMAIQFYTGNLPTPAIDSQVWKLVRSGWKASARPPTTTTTLSTATTSGSTTTTSSSTTTSTIATLCGDSGKCIFVSSSVLTGKSRRAGRCRRHVKVIDATLEPGCPTP